MLENILIIITILVGVVMVVAALYNFSISKKSKNDTAKLIETIANALIAVNNVLSQIQQQNKNKEEIENKISEEETKEDKYNSFRTIEGLLTNRKEVTKRE